MSSPAQVADEKECKAEHTVKKQEPLNEPAPKEAVIDGSAKPPKSVEAKALSKVAELGEPHSQEQKVQKNTGTLDLEALQDYFVGKSHAAARRALQLKDDLSALYESCMELQGCSDFRHSAYLLRTVVRQQLAICRLRMMLIDPSLDTIQQSIQRIHNMQQ